jgi:hypothetical protein
VALFTPSLGNGVQRGKRINLLGKIRLAAALFAVNVLYLALRPIIRGFELLFRTEKSIQESVLVFMAVVSLIKAHSD